MQFLKIIDATGLIRSLMAILCNLIYSIMSFCYDLFNNISQVDILTSQDIQPIYQRITMIITIVMIFYVTFQFVKYVVQPEGMTDKEKGTGKLVYKIVMVIVLIAFVPRIFQIAYDFQKKIIKSNIISNVILGPRASGEEENLGAAFSSSILNMFYYVEEENINKNCYDGIECGVLVNQNIGELKNDGKIKNIQAGLNETDSADNYLITFEFHGLIAVIVGGFICYILVLYCIDVGVRWAQLLYLQLIAPIPIIGYMSPKKDGMFQKWLKQCTTTYLDLFFRVAIINIILLLCDVLIKSRVYGGIAPDGSSPWMTRFMYVVLIMGVMLFAHKAPKLLAELFPKGGAASGNFGLKATERVAPEAARMAGMALGSTRFLGGAAARAINRHVRNKANNAKPFWTKEGKEQRKQRKQNQDNLNRMQRDMRLTQAVATGKSRVSDEQVNEAKQKVKTAQQKLEQAKRTGNQDDITRAESNLKNEASNYRKLMQNRNNMTGIHRFANEASNREIKDANTRYQQAKKELAEAKNNGNQEAIDKAEKKHDEAKKALEQQVSRFREIRTGNVDKSQANLEQAQWQVAKDNNEKYGSVIGAAAWGALAGGVTGAMEGVKAKKLEEIIPKAQAGAKKDVKNIQELNKYYDNGGAIGIQGTVERTISQFEKSLGIDTEYTKTIMSTKPLETKIKDLDAKMTLTKDVSSTVGSGEDRLKSKIYELKNGVSGEIKTGLTDSNGNAIKVSAKPNQTAGDLVREYDAKAEISKNEADAAAKRAEEAETNGTTGQQLADLKADAEKKAKKAADDKFASEQIKKNVARDAYTQILQHSNPEKESKFDQVAVQNIRDAQRSIKLAAAEPELREKVKEKLINGFGTSRGQHLYNSFISGIITTFDDMDDIKTAVINAQNEYARDKKDFQERKRQIETSELAQAQKAANDYNGNSGK